MTRARFFSLDGGGDLHLALRPLGFPAAAASFLSGTLVQGHLLLSGLEPGPASLVRELCGGGRESMPRLTEGDRPGAFLLSGRVDMLKRLGSALQQRPDVEGAFIAGGKVLRACFHAGAHRQPVVIGDKQAGAGRTLVMGIVNVTPDSFSDGGRFQAPERALAHARALVEAGADILDVGGESTRPKGPYGEGAQPVSPAEERARVEPVVRLLARELPHVPISVDTSRAEVAEPAIDAGAAMINDVRGLQDDALADVVRRHQVACCVMHMPGEPGVMAGQTGYEDVVAEVADALNEWVDRAQARGVPPGRLLVDPGFGFGKTAGQNLFLLRQLSLLGASVGRPVLVGTSRKGFLGQVTGRPVHERDAATAASVVAAILGGAAVVRVHDVAACRDAVQVADAVARSDEGGAFFASEED
ncbi:dihydropteroate synthase [Vulgatibacter sp.]|uniref:dihydropteroate synthase n=1 Tax=Vulgatibacter sp. TaxID=1971226 RepID=UPI00356ABE4C